MSAQKAFGMSVFRLIDALFTSEGYSRLSQSDGLYEFAYGSSIHKSDTISDLAEIAIREVEKFLTELINADGGVYYTHRFNGPLSEEFDGCFNVLERPYRIEFYTDTFRKGVVVLRKAHKVE